MTENLLKARAGNLPIIICRLPSVGASWKEPYPGWVDTSTASTAWIFNAAIGGSVNAVFNAATGDTMPCDLCCNTMLASPYFYSS